MISPRAGGAAVFLAALALRLTLWSNLAAVPGSQLRGDSSTYLAPAVALTRGGGFAAAPEPPWRPDAERPPGYPLFLAAHLLASPDLRWPSLTQSALDAGTAALVSLGAASLSAHPLAWAAGLLYALDWVAAAHAPLILSEALYGFLLTLSVLLLLRRAGAPEAGRAALSGLAAGGAVLARPISSALWLPWSLALAWAWPRRARRLAALFALAALLLPLLWCARNKAAFGRFAFNPVRSADALVWEAGALLAAKDGLSLDAGRARLYEEFARRHPEPMENPVERAAALGALSREIVLAHPWEAVRLFPVSMAKMLLGPGLDVIAETLWPGEALARAESRVDAVAGAGTLAVIRQRPALGAVAGWVALLLLATYVLAARGAWRLWRDGRRAELAALLPPILFLLVVSSGGWAYYRHRVPIMPLLALLAAAGLPSRSSAGRG